MVRQVATDSLHDKAEVSRFNSRAFRFFEELRPSQGRETELPAAIRSSKPSVKPPRLIQTPLPPTPPPAAAPPTPPAPAKPPPKARPKPKPPVPAKAPPKARPQGRTVPVRIQPVSPEARAAQTPKSMPLPKRVKVSTPTAPDTTLAPRRLSPSTPPDTHFSDILTAFADDVPETPAPITFGEVLTGSPTDDLAGIDAAEAWRPS